MKTNNYQVQMVVSLTPMVKAILIANALIWLVAVVIFQGYITKDLSIFNYLGLAPALAFEKFYLWQPFTYIFIHDSKVWHVLFNSLIVWFIGSELEKIWGSKDFLRYYLVCGVGAGLLYSVVIYAAVFFFGLKADFLYIPTVGASGAVFGLLVAYGLIFGERLIYFMMLFPMKAKYFVGLLAVVEVATLLTSGFGGAVNNTAHIGGFIVGFVYLTLKKRLDLLRQKKWFRKPGRKLELVIDNDEKKKGPTYH